MSEATRLPGWLVPAAAAGVILTFVAGIFMLDSPLAVLLPAGMLALAFSLSKIFPNPVQLLAVFLLVIVNLDFVKVSGGLTLDVVLSSVVLALLMLRAAMAVPRTVSAAPGLERWLIAFLVAAGISVVLSVLPAQSIKRYGRELEYLAIVFLLLRHPLSRREVRLLLGATLAATIVPSVLGIAGYVFKIDAFLGQELYLENLYQGEARVRSTLSHPVVFSIFLMVTLTVTAALWLSRTWFPRWVTAPLGLLQLLALYVTYGRTGWMGFAAAAAALLWLRGLKRYLLLGVPVVAVVAWKFIPNFRERWESVLTASESNSFLWRLGLWDHALRLYPEKPVFGSGLGTFLEYVDYLQGFNSHQTWTGLLVETGAVGMLVFLILFVVLGRSLLRAIRGSTSEDRPLAQAAFAVWFGMLAASLTSDPFAMPSATIYAWVLFCVALNPPGRRG